MARQKYRTTFVRPEDERAYVAAGYWTTDITLSALLTRNCERWPQQLAVVDDGGGSATYAELSDRAHRLAGGLVERGVAEGDVVGVQMPNRVEAVIAMLAVQLAGGIVCPLVTPYRHRELSFIAKKTSMKALFVPGKFRRFDHDALAWTLLDECPALELVVTLTKQMGKVDKVVNFEDLEQKGVAREGPNARVVCDPMAVSTILFTSGTESDPKGIRHTDNTLLASLRTLQRMLGLTEGDGVFMPSPVGHGTGYGFGIYLAMYLGSTLALLGQWDAAKAANVMSDHRSVYTHGATPFVQDLLALPEIGSVDLSALRYFVTGGAAVPRGMASVVRQKLDCGLLRLYGQTEGFMCSLSGIDDPVDVVDRTDGRPVSGVEVRVVDGDGLEVPLNVAGECEYKGPHRCVGFLDDERRAAASLTADGWFRSGDLVRIDEHGFLAVVGRQKEVINRGGYKYSPREVEDILSGHPAIDRVAVVRMGDRRLVERACAFVVPRGPGRPTIETVAAYLREHGVAAYKWPERVEVVKEFPMTASGKVQKYLLEGQLERLETDGVS